MSQLLEEKVLQRMEKPQALHGKFLNTVGRLCPFDHRLEKETLVPQMKAQSMQQKPYHLKTVANEIFNRLL